MEADREVMTTGEPVSWRSRFRRRAPCGLSTRPRRRTGTTGARAGVIGVSSDITELKKAEEELREIREAERSRIARELHDVVLQDLTYALQPVQLPGDRLMATLALSSMTLLRP